MHTRANDYNAAIVPNVEVKHIDWSSLNAGVAAKSTATFNFRGL